MSNHKPATPLPWKQMPYKDGLRDKETIRIDDAFELHAANAYPRLVEALKKQTAQVETLQQWAQECRQKRHSITAEALWSKLNGMVWNGAPLLRELGEL